MKIDSVSIKGKVTSFEISEKIFSSDINNKLIGQVLYSQIANLKPRLAKTKQRNEIRGSTVKIYAQKGTGNARHASKKAPLFIGGGVAHGPKGKVYKVRKTNKGEKKSSLISAISQKTKDKNLIIFEDIKNKISKTKQFIKFLKTNRISNALIVVDLITKKNIELSARNIPNIKLIDASYLATYDILKYKQIMFTESSTRELEKRLLKYE
jgi:large subunit ribosomal protein L4